MKTIKKITVVILIAILLLMVSYKFYAIKQKKNDAYNLVNKAKSEVPVSTITAKYSDVAYDLSYNGTFEPWCEVSVISEASGKVKEYRIEEGNFVSEGKTVVWLENDVISYQLKTAEAAFMKAKSDLERSENLSQGEAISTQQLEESKLAYENANSAYLTLQKQFDNTFIKVPISATVSKRYIEKGTYLAPGSPVLDLIDNRKMKFIVWFSAADRVNIRTGQKVRITTDLLPNASFEGVIKTIGIKPDESKRYCVKAEVQNNTRTLVAGIDGTMHLSLKPDRKNIAIPRNCIIGSVIDPKVYVVEKGLAKLHPVVIYRIINGTAYISRGLDEEDQVIVSGQINIDDNTKVRVSENQNF